MANVVKARLSNNKDEIIRILEAYDFHNISGDSYIAFAFDCDSTGSCKLNSETLSFKRWSDGSSGDIISAVMLKTGWSFKEALMDLRNKLGISEEYCTVSKVDTVQKSSLFDGLFKDISSLKGELIYTDREVDRFQPIISTMFRKDNINIMTQHEFDIRYCGDTDRIVILWRNLNGEVVGCNARSNWDIKNDYKYKYLSLLPFHKGGHLYGLFENGLEIGMHKTAIVFESEKSVLQAASFGCNLTVALGCSSMRKEQVKLLYQSGARKIILALDEDIEYLHYINMAMEIKQWFPDLSVYAMYDKNNEFIEKGAKSSPADMGLEIFQGMLNKCLTKIC